MFTNRLSTSAGRRGFFATVAVAVCVLGGGIMIGVAIASQQAAPEVAAMSEQTPPLVSLTPLPKPSPTVVGPVMARSKPVRLDIPSIDVHSVIRSVGQTEEGALEVPPPGPRYNDAAWYRYSPTPGSLGPAILLGHVDSAADGPSVFFRLGELKRGDRISVTRADDSVAVFVVDEIHRYAKDNFPTRTVYGNIDHAGLRILTCGGAFDDSTGHYLDNVVVFASLAGSH